MSSQDFDYTVADFNLMSSTRTGRSGCGCSCPSAPGRFRFVVDIHGGAWCNGDLKGLQNPEI